MLISPTDVIEMVKHGDMSMQDGRMTWRLFRPLNLPEDVKTVGVFIDYSYHSFAVVIEHPSFEPIPECDQLPIVQREVEFVRIAVNPIQS